jgi:hypothetical protein
VERGDEVMVIGRQVEGAEPGVAVPLHRPDDDVAHRVAAPHHPQGLVGNLVPQRGVHRAVRLVQQLEEHLRRVILVVPGDLFPQGQEPLAMVLGVEGHLVIALHVQDDVQVARQRPVDHLVHAGQEIGIDRIRRLAVGMRGPVHGQAHETETPALDDVEIVLLDGHAPVALVGGFERVADVHPALEEDRGHEGVVDGERGRRPRLGGRHTRSAGAGAGGQENDQGEKEYPEAHACLSRAWINRGRRRPSRLPRGSRPISPVPSCGCDRGTTGGPPRGASRTCG